MRFFVLLFFAFTLFFSQINSALAQMENTVVIDTPTAYTIEPGMYKISGLAYDEGGAEVKTVIGIHYNVYLGISFDVQHAIGKQNPNPNIPGVIAKLKFTDGFPTFPLAIALGYDSFCGGNEGRENEERSDNELNRMRYGPYLVFSAPVFLFDAEQYISFGIKTPTQPDYVPDDTSYFVGFDMPLSESFRFKTEAERIYWDFKDFDDWLLGFGLKYSYFEQVGLEFDIILQKDEKPNRILRLEYSDEF